MSQRVVEPRNHAIAQLTKRLLLFVGLRVVRLFGFLKLALFALGHHFLLLCLGFRGVAHAAHSTDHVANQEDHGNHQGCGEMNPRNPGPYSLLGQQKRSAIQRLTMP